MARRVKSESLENLRTVVEASKDKTVNAVGDMGVVMANAVAESERNDEYVAEVMGELKKEAGGLTPEEGSTGEPVEDRLNKKLQLSEDLEDFVDTPAEEKQKKTREVDDTKAETYLEYDMFDFIYELLSTYNDPRRTPKQPLDHEQYRFGGFGRDKYKGLDAQTASLAKRIDACDALGIDYKDDYDKTVEAKITAKIKEQAAMSDNGGKGPSIASGGDYIELYAQVPEILADAIAICDMFGFKYKGPDATYAEKRPWLMKKKDEWLSYRYTLKIYIPCNADGFPMSIQEYFEPRGIDWKDIMPDVYVTGYEKEVARQERDAAAAQKKAEREAALANKEAAKAQNDKRVDEIVDEFIIYAAQHGDESLEGIKRNMISKMREEKLTFKIKDVTDKLFNAFDDSEFDDAE